MNFKIEVKNFSLRQTLLSGQCFRFYEVSQHCFRVFAYNNFAEIIQEGDVLNFTDSSCDSSFWVNYFDLNGSYASYLFGFKGDLILEKAASFCGNIHILNQHPFEVLISFLLSSNNNISRIKKIISVLCENFGSRLDFGFAFPTVEQLKGCSLYDFEVLRAGFRSKYILDAVLKVSSGEVDLQAIQNFSLSKAKEELLKIRGVGSKIADCVLLFAYHRFEVFPVDVWIKRVVEKYYGSGLSRQILSCPGFAQQILYHSMRKGLI